MEQVRFLTLLTLCLSLIACRSEDPNPELRDPIYSGLNSELGKAKSAFEAGQKRILEVEQQIASAQTGSQELKMARRNLIEAKKKLVYLEQTYEYLKIRTEHRKYAARREYRLAFYAKKEWPNPQDSRHLATHLALRSAPRSWDQRVPKLNDRITNVWGEPGAKPAKK